MADTPAEVLAPVKSPAASTINWAQIAGFLASIGVYFGIDIPPEEIMRVLLGIQGAVALFTFIKHTWFEASVLAPSAKTLT